MEVEGASKGLSVGGGVKPAKVSELNILFEE